MRRGTVLFDQDSSTGIVGIDGFVGSRHAAEHGELALVHSGGLMVRDGSTVLSTRPSEQEPDVSTAGWIGDIEFLQMIADSDAEFAPQNFTSHITVTATKLSRVLVWDVDMLRRKLREADGELTMKLQQVLIASLVSKLFASHQSASANIPIPHDRQLVDLDGDGIADAAVVDTIGEGLLDTFINASTGTPLPQLSAVSRGRRKHNRVGTNAFSSRKRKRIHGRKAVVHETVLPGGNHKQSS